MFETVNAPLGGARSVPLVEPEGEIILVGWDFSAADFLLEVRDRPNGGALRAQLSKVSTAAAEGVRIVSVETVDSLPVTKLGIRINETTMEAMPEAEPGEDVTLSWGMHITPAGGTKFLAFEGPFTVKASTPQ